MIFCSRNSNECIVFDVILLATPEKFLNTGAHSLENFCKVVNCLGGVSRLPGSGFQLVLTDYPDLTFLDYFWKMKLPSHNRLRHFSKE